MREKQLANQIDELRHLAARDELSEQLDQVLNRELANYTMTEQQRTEIVAALLQRFPKLATVEFEPKAIGKALATIERHTRNIARTRP